MRIFYIFLFILSFTLCSYCEEVNFYKVAVDIESDISAGELSIEDIVKIASRLDIDALILGDEFCKEFKYGVGPGPLKYFFRKTVTSDSAYSYGLGKYLNLVEQINTKYPDVLLIEGFEVSPYYWWRGSALRGNLQLIDWHRQFIVTGLDYNDYNDLPTTSKGNSKYSQYTKDLWFEPYQDFIDFVDKRGGLVFWAHPDESYNENFGGINVFTQHYPQILNKTNNYTGFCVLFGGYHDTGRVGGIWDDLLMSYCSNKRKHPVWAIGELDYTQAKEIEKMDELVNFVRAIEKNREDILSTIRKGRMHVSWKAHQYGIYLEDFYLIDNLSGEKSYSGGTLDTKGDLSLVVKLKITKTLESPLKINVLKNAKLFDIKELNITKENEIEIIIKDKINNNKPGYYRTEINYRGAKIISNPIFFKNDS